MESMLSIQVLQVWSRELVEIEKLKVTTKFEIAYEQAPYYVDLVGSQSGRWQSRTKKETSKRKLMPNHFISAAIPDIYFVMTLYKSTIWKGTTAIGSLVLPVDDLNNLKNAGPLWCNLIQWNRKTHSIDSKGRALLRVLSNPTLVHSQDKKCESFVGNVSIHPNHICLPFGNQMSHHQMKLDTMERAHYEEATAPCLD